MEGNSYMRVWLSYSNNYTLMSNVACSASTVDWYNVHNTWFVYEYRTNQRKQQKLNREPVAARHTRLYSSSLSCIWSTHTSIKQFINHIHTNMMVFPFLLWFQNLALSSINQIRKSLRIYRAFNLNFLTRKFHTLTCKMSVRIQYKIEKFPSSFWL